MHNKLIGRLVKFKSEGNYSEFHNAIGLVTSHNKPDHVRVQWIKPVHYAVESDHYIHFGPTKVSDFELARFEVLS